jgi:hypothetical protein
MDWLILRAGALFLGFVLIFNFPVFATNPEVPNPPQPAEKSQPQAPHIQNPAPTSNARTSWRMRGPIRRTLIGTRARLVTTCVVATLGLAAYVAPVWPTSNGTMSGALNTYVNVRDFSSSMGVDNSDQSRAFDAFTNPHFDAIESARLINELQADYEPGMRLANTPSENNSTTASTQAASATQNSAGGQP